MDGNRRWAKANNFPTFEGHRCGRNKLREVVRWTKAAGATHFIVYAFSTENWNRSKAEVSYLLDLFRLVLSKEIGEMKKEGVRILCAGDRSRFPADLQNMMRNAEQETSTLPGPTLVLALSYGGRSEILNAVREIVVSKEKHITEEVFNNHLWTKGVPDPDLIIRTGGEMRLSGFLPWQSVYSELFFTKTLWPDFSEEEFSSILSAFAARKRNFGL